MEDALKYKGIVANITIRPKLFANIAQYKKISTIDHITSKGRQTILLVDSMSDRPYRW